MAKKSQRRSMRYEKDQAGCIWGLINIFDIRYGRSTGKLLADRRRGFRHAVGAAYSRTKLKKLTNFNEKCESNEDGEESETATADFVKTSVKELMEEEMFNEKVSKKHMNSSQEKSEQFDSECGGHLRKNRKRKNKTCTKSCDMQVVDVEEAKNLGPENSCHQLSEQKTSSNLDLEVIMEELCQIHQKNTNCDWHDDLNMQSNQSYSLVEENLSAAIKMFVNQTFTNGKHLTEDRKTHNSTEFTDAIQTLSSNKELFLKLIQDPNSLIVKHIKGMEVAQLEEDHNTNSLAGSNLLEKNPSNSRPDEQIPGKHRSLFRRKSKSQESNPLKGIEKCQPPSRIVILKPGPSGLRNPDTEISDNFKNRGQSERNASQFSFAGIRRKLKHAMGKEQHGISGNGITDRFPCKQQNLGDSEKGVGEENGGWSSPNRNHFYTEIFSKPPIGIKRGDKNGKSRDFETSLVNETIGFPKQGVSNIYIEAKKYLSEMLSDGDEKELTSMQLPETLGRILSLPEYNFSPSSSPGKDGEHSFVTAQMRLSTRGNFHMVNENTCQLIQENHAVQLNPSRQEFERRACITTNDNPDAKVQSPNSCPGILDEHNRDSLVEDSLSSAINGTSSIGVVEIVMTTATGCQQDSEVMDVLCETSSSLITRDVHICDAAEVCAKERSSQCLKLDSFEEDQLFSSPSVSPSSSSVTRKIEDPESATNRIERPSPISVLEPLFTEDNISPASTISRPVKTAIQPLQIHFEEHMSSATDQAIYIRTCMENEESAFEYVEAVLLASSLNWDEFLLRWLSSDQLLDPSLFDEVELFSNRSCHDQKLLFDCTNEVLKEVCERYFGCSFVNHNIRPVPKAMNLIHEVWEGVEWHLLQPPPHSLDQLVRKDMAKSRKWMDLRFETEHIVFELGKSILEELMDDTIWNCVSDSMEGEFSVITAELNEDGSTFNL